MLGGTNTSLLCRSAVDKCAQFQCYNKPNQSAATYSAPLDYGMLLAFLTNIRWDQHSSLFCQSAGDNYA